MSKIDARLEPVDHKPLTAVRTRFVRKVGRVTGQSDAGLSSSTPAQTV
jgi:hypothetical protein